MINSMKTVTKSYNGDGVEISSNAQNKLQQMKSCGIKKVELICIDNCECCSSYRNCKVPIEKAVELPREDCPLERCRGRWAAVIEFDLS